MKEPDWRIYGNEDNDNQVNRQFSEEPGEGLVCTTYNMCKVHLLNNILLPKINEEFRRRGRTWRTII